MTATTEDIVAHVRDWAIEKIECYGETETSNRMAIIEEFYEWINPEEDFEVVSLEQ